MLHSLSGGAKLHPPKVLKNQRPDIVLPAKFTHAKEPFSGRVHAVTLGGSGTRTSSLVIGGEKILPFRYMEGEPGNPPAIAMEVFDVPPEKYPQTLRDYSGT